MVEVDLEDVDPEGAGRPAEGVGDPRRDEIRRQGKGEKKKCFSKEKQNSPPGSVGVPSMIMDTRAKSEGASSDEPGGTAGENRAPGGLSHLEPGGAARMVDVGEKIPTKRKAAASGRLRMLPATLELIRSGKAAKGDVLATARIAAIQAAKETSRLIPLCHSLPLECISVGFTFEGTDTLRIRAEARATAKTGVEMEALTAVVVASLTVYDMLKAVDRGMTIEAVRLESKTGGKSDYRR